MLRGSPQSEIDRHAYIPPDVEKSLNQHFAQSMPGHLKQYVGSNSSGFVSRGMEQALSKQMQKNLPPHLQAYADAYVQQHVVQPIVEGRPSNASFAPAHNPPPVPDQLRRDHSMPVGQQHSVDPNTLPVAAKGLFEPDAKVNEAPLSTDQKIESNNPYEFILQPEQTAKSESPIKLGGLPPVLSRALVFAGGLILLIIVFSLIKGSLSGGSNLSSLTAVAQDQTELLHVLSSTTQQQNSTAATLSDPNLIATMQLTLSSSRSQLISYLAVNGHKLSNGQLSLKLSSSTDQNLTSAITSGNYSQTLNQVLQNQVNGYITDITNAYNQTKGPKGLVLLKSTYAQAKLFQNQFNSANAS